MHWSRPRVVAFPDRADLAQGIVGFYGLLGVPYESLWLGLVRVSALDRDGQPLPNLAAEQCRAVTGDSTAMPVTWDSGDLGGRPALCGCASSCNQLVSTRSG